MRARDKRTIDHISIKPIRWVMDQLLGIIDVVLDEFYDRFDLWQNKELEIVDYNKVRGFILLYLVVCPIIWYITITARIIPTTFLLTMLMGLTALSIGERMYAKYLFIWGRKTDIAANIEMPSKEILRQSDPEVKPPTESDNQ